MVASESAARLPAGCLTPSELPTELARLVDAWPDLPDHVRRTILILVDGCK
ncbi:MAG: hypothetical protein L0Z62_10480 [Gemmataceae bacterium]|nr:hypothetical protein [Gemmataceae bacterium]